MAYKTFVTGSGSLQPVCQVPAVAGAGGRLTRAVNEMIKTNRLVCSFIDLVTRAGEWISLNALRKLFAEAG